MSNNSNNLFRTIKILESINEENYIHNDVIYIYDKVEAFEVKAGDGILLKINGIFKRNATVCKTDIIEYAVNGILATSKVNVKINSDFMKAFAYCSYEDGSTYTILDKYFDEVLLLERGTEIKVKSKKISPTQLIENLKQEGIVYGFNYKAFEEVINGKEALIASGIEIVKTINESLELAFENTKTDNNNLGKKDYFNLDTIKSVKKGEIIARVINGQKGIDGKNIRGMVLEAGEIKSINLKVASGVRRIGNTIISTVDGMPIYNKKNPKLEVKKVYELPLDVDIKTGNIKFNGSVIVRGSVCDNFSVYASSSIDIKGNATNAFIKSLANVNIQGKVLNTKIESGFLSSNFESINKFLTKLLSDFKALKGDLDVIVKSNFLNNKKLGSVIKVLLDAKYPEIEKSYEFIKSDVEKLFASTNNLSALFEKKIIGLCSINIKSLDEIDDILNVIKSYIKDINSIFNIDSSVRLSYVQGSEVYSKGDIIILNEGVYASKLVSDLNIIFEDDRTILRGGHLVANNFIKTGVVGTRSGVKTDLELLHDGVIECKEAYFNTKFKINKKTIILEENYKNLKVYVDDGVIILDGLRL